MELAIHWWVPLKVSQSRSWSNSDPTLVASFQWFSFPLWFESCSLCMEELLVSIEDLSSLDSSSPALPSFAVRKAECGALSRMLPWRGVKAQTWRSFKTCPYKAVRGHLCITEMAEIWNVTIELTYYHHVTKRLFQPWVTPYTLPCTQSFKQNWKSTREQALAKALSASRRLPCVIEWNNGTKTIRSWHHLEFTLPITTYWTIQVQIHCQELQGRALSWKSSKLDPCWWHMLVLNMLFWFQKHKDIRITDGSASTEIFKGSLQGETDLSWKAGKKMCSETVREVLWKELSKVRSHPTPRKCTSGVAGQPGEALAEGSKEDCHLGDSGNGSKSPAPKATIANALFRMRLVADATCHPSHFEMSFLNSDILFALSIR